MMLSYWRESQRRAVETVRSGIADWTITLGVDAYRWSTIRSDQSIHFVGLESQDEWDWTLPRPDKARRREEHRSAADLRLRAIEDECAGLCLTWSENDGWQVKASRSPRGLRVDRHRLLKAGSDRPKFWLFESDGRFVARVCDVKLQALADTPHDAIDALRRALGQYRRAYPQTVVQTPSLAVLQPLRDEARREYELRLGSTLHCHGFWRGAPMFQSIAWDYLQARSERST